ncbi:hypothetical protein PIB30_048014 [Stylosanthes scabra]|uniref:Uncharacterized protein n=1 Tax=Stylosanthes scabra TaxID=79078 RepID=A0ABU6WF03_9FABA|nr:hypothetical protein [Stylosanthes scabra]
MGSFRANKERRSGLAGPLSAVPSSDHLELEEELFSGDKHRTLAPTELLALVTTLRNEIQQLRNNQNGNRGGGGGGGSGGDDGEDNMDTDDDHRDDGSDNDETQV